MECILRVCKVHCTNFSKPIFSLNTVLNEKIGLLKFVATKHDKVEE